MDTKKDFQVVIAGAGPAGALLGRELARAGISVAIYESKARGTIGHNWSDAVEKNALQAAGFEMPTVAKGSFHGRLVKTDESDRNLFEKHVVNPLQICAPDLSCKTKTDVDFRYITTDRMELSRLLIRQAIEAGVQIFYEHKADTLTGSTRGELESLNVTGVQVTDLKTGNRAAISAHVTVDATGFQSRLRTGLDAPAAISRPFSDGELAFACRTVRKLDASKTAADTLTDHYRYGAFKGYFWTHLHSDDVIDVGGGVKEEAGRIDPWTIINEMIAKRPSITDEELRKGGGIVLVGRSPYSMVASGFLAVGDAAGQVIPTTGCGVGAGLTGALAAAQTIIKALSGGTVGIESLWHYNWGWFANGSRGGHYAALSALKEILQDLSHEDLAFLMRKDILSGEMLTPSINGIFYIPDLKTMLKTLINGFSRPALLMKLNQATTAGKKLYNHYQNYPKVWNSEQFKRWEAESERLFGNTTA